MKNLIILIITLFIFCNCNKDNEFTKSSNTLPTFKININEKYLWSPDSGLYVIGNNGILGCNTIANYNQKWEFPAEIEFWNNDEFIFYDKVGFRIKGKCSRSSSMKSIGLYWRKEYNNSHLEYPIFEENNITSYKRLHLRNSGNDFGKTHIKDAVITQITKEFALFDFQEYMPCVVYLNNKYWGLYNLREMITPHHFKYHYNVDKDNVNILVGPENNPYIDDGSSENYMTNVVDFLNNHDLSQDRNFKDFAERIDINSYTDYIITETYICNVDWPQGNAKWWNENTTSGYTKWRWIVYDTDYCMRLENVNKVWLGNLIGTPYSESQEGGFFIFNHLIKNNNYKNFFYNRYLFFIDHVFNTERFNSFIQTTKNKISEEYPYHSQKWSLLSVNQWEKEIDELIEFNTKRNKLMKTTINRLMDEK